MKQTLTYPQFLKDIRHIPFDAVEDYVGDLAHTERALSVLRHCLPLQAGIFIIAYPLNRYIYGDEHFARFAGVSRRELTRHSATNIRKVYAPDSRMFEQRLFADRAMFFNNVPVSEHAEYRMRCTYRLHSSNRLINLMQDNRYIRTTADGKPLVSIGAITDIRNDSRMVNTIYREDRAVWSDTYVSLDTGEAAPLTKQQYRVAELICEGLTNKEIAEKLYRSIKTVDNHRQGIYRKTNCRNAVELLKFLQG